MKAIVASKAPRYPAIVAVIIKALLGRLTDMMEVTKATNARAQEIGCSTRPALVVFDMRLAACFSPLGTIRLIVHQQLRLK